MGKNQQDKGMIPIPVLNRLSEFTIGGFALFYFDPETGFPRHVLSFDSPAHNLAMQKYMTDWNNALQNVYIEGAKSNIRHTMNEEDEDEGSIAE